MQNTLGTKKLSELPDDEDLIVYYDDRVYEIVVNKKQLIEDISFGCNVTKVYTCKPYSYKFCTLDLHYMLECESDDMYDSWAEEFYEDIKDDPATIASIELLNNCSKKRCTYYEDNEVVIDMNIKRKRLLP